MIEHLELDGLRLKGVINKKKRTVVVSIASGSFDRPLLLNIVTAHPASDQNQQWFLSFGENNTGYYGNIKLPLRSQNDSVEIKLSLWEFMKGDKINDPKYKFAAVGLVYLLYTNTNDLWDVNSRVKGISNSCKEVTLRHMNQNPSHYYIVIGGVFPKGAITQLKNWMRNIPEENRPQITKIYGGIIVRVNQWWYQNLYYRMGWLFLAIRMLGGRYNITSPRLQTVFDAFIEGRFNPPDGVNFDSINNWIKNYT